MMTRRNYKSGITLHMHKEDLDRIRRMYLATVAEIGMSTQKSGRVSFNEWMRRKLLVNFKFDFDNFD